jgi:dTDP-4-amino-4,6-dideoxygalactose transaminase
VLPFTRPSISEEEINAVVEVLKSGWITTGPKVAELEKALSDYIGAHLPVRLFNSATAALEDILLACDIGPGDEVIVPAMSFVATANVVVRVGAKPVFVDVDLHSRNLDVERVEQALTPSTRAIIPVHFAGLAVDMDPLYALAEKHKLIVIEDAAQAIGTTYKGRQIGASGNPVVFSFHPNKNMTTIEGGALTCSDSEIIKRVERLRFHGIERNELGEISVAEWGGKSNLPDVSAALGLVQLKKLDGFNERRRQLAQRYLATLKDHPALVKPAGGEGHSWHMFCVRIDSGALDMTRNQIIDFLREREIAAGVHYPAIHTMPLYRRFGYGPGDFPNAERIGEQTITLPLFPAMTEADVDQVCNAFHELLDLE